MAATSLLEVSDVRLHFGGIRALDGVKLTVNKDEFLGVIGPNGAGKTTLFNVITGVLRPDSGSVRFEGEELTRRSPDVICRLGVARTYQRVRSFPRLTVLQNILVPIVNRNRPAVSRQEAHDIAQTLMARVGLSEFAGDEARRLNLYHRKKIELARAIATGAKLIMLDEVMAGLNSVEADAASDLLRSLKQDYALTIVCIEHLMRIIMAVSDRIVVLDHGKVISTGKPAEVAADPQVQSAYLGSDHV